jgi:hypothetical protein
MPDSGCFFGIHFLRTRPVAMALIQTKRLWNVLPSIFPA